MKKKLETVGNGILWLIAAMLVFPVTLLAATMKIDGALHKKSNHQKRNISLVRL
jgi:hypothetical protein